tara:strand:- start:2012 stop:2209 length:198 start_codon:yes stop_codon:yes gene_type:complete
MKLSSEHKFQLTEIQEKLSNIFNELGKILVTEDDRDLDDIMQRVEQIKLELDELMDDYNIKVEND